jgi:uncharacterized protein YoxC
MLNLVPILSFGLEIIILIVTACCFVKIMKNDLTHLQKDVTEIKGDTKHLFNKVNGLCERVSKIEGKLEINE